MDKKDPSPRFAVRRTLFDLVIMLDHERSAQGKVQSATVRDFCPALIVRHRAWYQMMEQRSSHRKSREWFFFFFVQGSRTLSSQTVPTFRVSSVLCWPWGRLDTRIYHAPFYCQKVNFHMRLVFVNRHVSRFVNTNFRKSRLAINQDV